MKRIFKIGLVLIALGGLCSSCHKYQDDPFISFTSLANSWQLKNFKVNGIDSTSKFLSSTASGLPILSINVQYNNFALANTNDGGGGIDLDRKKGEITFIVVNYLVGHPGIYLFPLQTNTYNILELYRTIFKIATTINGNYYELTFNLYE